MPHCSPSPSFARLPTNLLSSLLHALAELAPCCCKPQSKGPHRRQSHSDSAAAATAAAAVKPKYGIEEGEYGDEELQLLPAGSARRLSRVGRAAAGSGGGDNCGGGCDAPVAASGNGSAALRRSSMNGGSGGSGGGLLVHDSARSSNEPVLPLSSSSAAAADLDLEGAIARQLRGEDEEDEPEEVAALFKADDHLRHMTRMGLLSGLAVGLHNIPEGLATFVGTIAKPSSGLVIALAIALHNIPEGIVVAIPVYYATKSRLKSFLWASLSGFAEPLGAVLGYLLVSTNHLNPVVYAVVYGLVAGMMTYLALKELLPTALRYDPEDK